MNNLLKMMLLIAVYLTLGGNILAQKKMRPIVSQKLVTTGQRPLTGNELLAKIHRVALEQGIPPRLFESLIRQESAGNLRAVSYKGAACLTQLMPDTARRYGLVVNGTVDERFNIDKCLVAGAQYLRFQLETFRDVRLALAGYNAGEGNVIKYNYRIPPFRETTEYVEKICYMAYGQRGHAIAMAFNQPYAAQIVNSVYRSRFYPNNLMELQVTPLPKSPTNETEAVVEPEKEEVEEETKPIRTKVELPARIKVSGLFFKQ